MQHQILEQCEINQSKFGLGNTQTVVRLTSAAAVLSGDLVGGKFAIGRAAGMDITLPPAVGSGGRLEFFITVTATSNAYVFDVADGDEIAGMAFMKDGDGEPGNAWADDDAVKITLGGTSNATGGTKGARVVLDDVAPGLWSVVIFDSQSGTEATPFS